MTRLLLSVLNQVWKRKRQTFSVFSVPTFWLPISGRFHGKTPSYALHRTDQIHPKRAKLLPPPPGAGTQYYEMRHVPPKRSPFLSPLSPNDPLVYAPPIEPLTRVRPPISDLCRQRPPISDFVTQKPIILIGIQYPKPTTKALDTQSRNLPMPRKRVLRDPTGLVTITEATTLSLKAHNLRSVTKRPPLPAIFWLLLSQKDPYVWGAWWHLYWYTSVPPGFPPEDPKFTRLWELEAAVKYRWSWSMALSPKDPHL